MKCFVTGADEKNQDILNWFLKNFKKHNKTKIFVAGFGNLNNADFFVDTKGQNPWFFKATCMKKTEYSSVCWLDCDIEIKDCIDNVFDLIDNNVIGLTKDWGNPKCEWQTGLVCTNNIALLEPWQKECLTFKHRGDQEALHKIRNRINISRLPDIYQWLRIGPAPPQNIKCYHWTGPKGKKHIRERLCKDTLL